MAWKRKEKKLTKEEAIALAKKELAPCWFLSGPLLAAVKTPTGVTAYPLDPAFTARAWLIFFLNPTTTTGESTIAYAREMQRRYGINNVGVLLIFRPDYRYLKDARPIELFMRRHQITFPLVVDADGLLHAAFGATTLPTVVLHGEGGAIFSESGTIWTEKTEQELQHYLRASDPGLALLPPFHPAKAYTVDHTLIELGYNRHSWSQKTNFAPFAEGVYSGAFAEPPKDRMTPGEITLHGRWFQDADRIVTSDREARIELQCSGSGLSLVAQSMAKTLEFAKIVFDVEGAPAYEFFAAADLSFDEEGQSSLRLEGPRLYHALQALPVDKRRISLRFPLADRVGVALYGIRCHDGSG